MSGRGRAENRSGGLEDWWGFRVGEIEANPDTNLFPEICDYQAALGWDNPAGTYSYGTTYSSFHSGCSWSAWMDFPGSEGRYVENTRFPAKWRSNHTNRGGWQALGTLVD